MDKDIEEQEPEEEQDQSQKQGLDSKAIDYINRARRANEDIHQNKPPKNTRERFTSQIRNRFEQAGKRTVGKAGKRVAQRVGRKAAVAAGQTLIETAPVWGIPALIILVIIIVIIVIFGGTQNTSGGVPPLTCADISGTCQTSCASPNTPDTTGATCTGVDAGKICCVPQPPPGAQPPIHFYCQYDPRWTSSLCNIKRYGCTPTSVAMIITSYGVIKTPVSVALANGSNGCFSGSSAKDFLPWVQSLGFAVGPNLAAGSSFNTTDAKKYISNGYFILAGANILFNKTLSGHGPHAFVIGGVDSLNNALVYDPTFCSYDTSYSTRTFNVFGFNPYGVNTGTALSPLLWNVDGKYWFWAYPIKKL